MSTGIAPKLAFFALLAAFLVIRGRFAWKARQSGHSPSFSDDAAVEQPRSIDVAILIVVLLCVVGLLVLYAVDPEALGWLNVPLPGWLRWSGAGIAVAGLALQVWTHRTLQDRWFGAQAAAESHVLITEGPYRWVRHPLYAGLMLYLGGLAGVSAYWPFVVLAILAVPMLYRAGSSEEAPLLKRFPVEYPEYMGRTPRFFPRIKLGGR